MKPARFDYVRTRSINETLDQLARSKGEGKLFAGGQSLGPMLNLRLARPELLIDIRHVPELHRFEADDRRFAIGSTFTHAEVEDGVLEDFTRGLLPFVAHGIAYRAIRNRGTIGGSLAHADPAADWVSTMAAVGATVVVSTAELDTRRIPAETFLAGAFASELSSSEVINAIEVRRFPPSARWGYHKICRKTGEFAKAIGISIMDDRNGHFRVVAGATEGKPLLLSQTSEILGRDGPSRAANTVHEEIGSLLPHIDAARRQQLSTAVCRSLAQLSKGQSTP